MGSLLINSHHSGLPCCAEVGGALGCCDSVGASAWNTLPSDGWMLSLPHTTTSFMIQPASKLDWELIWFKISLPKI